MLLLVRLLMTVLLWVTGILYFIPAAFCAVFPKFPFCFVAMIYFIQAEHT